MLDAIDITVMNMALPPIQQDVGMSVTTLSWVLNGYTVAYGGLLLLGGRMGDIIGHREGLMTGITIFTVASLTGALAQDAWLLLISRFAQGAGAAMTAPCALALIVTSFHTEVERTKAFGISVMTQGLGFAGGLIIGGLLTDLISWRPVLLINVPIGIVVLLATPRFIPQPPGRPGKFDLGGALSATIGAGAIVYGFIHASEQGWSEPETLVAFILRVVLLGILVMMIERSDAKTAMVSGLVLAVLSMLWLTQLSASTEWSGIFGPMALAGVGVGVGVGVGMLNPPPIGTTLSSVAPEESGAASGVLQTKGVVGGSIGTAVLVKVFSSATNDPSPGQGPKRSSRTAPPRPVSAAPSSPWSASCSSPVSSARRNSELATFIESACRSFSHSFEGNEIAGFRGTKLLVGHGTVNEISS
ncbi:MFS transporter [Streptomyces canus]|uniref:MFS transporter n=1 Tax=Streptomyces canus TaxID=58343 RepID=UPI00352FD9E6